MVDALSDAFRTFKTSRGKTLIFTCLGLGSAPLGNMGRVLSETESDEVVGTAWACGVRYFDTAPLYGHGLAETRIGRALKAKSRDDFLLSTKVGRLLSPCSAGEEAAGIYLSPPPFRVSFDYRRDGVLRSFEASLARLDVDRLDILYVHDLEPGTHGSAEAYEARWSELTNGGGWRALDELRAEGVVAAIGMGVNDSAPCQRVLAEFDPDLFLVAGRYTLLEQGPLRGLLPACQRRGVGVVVGGPYNSGILARRGGWYDYARAPAQVLERVDRLSAVCDRFGVPLKAAALQFPIAHPAVVSVIPGGQTPEEVAGNARLTVEPIPDELWACLKSERLLDSSAPTPGLQPHLAC